MSRHPKSISDLPDEKLPRPFWTELISGDGHPPQIKIRFHPKMAEIMREAEKRALKLEDGKFKKK